MRKPLQKPLFIALLLLGCTPLFATPLATLPTTSGIIQQDEDPFVRVRQLIQKRKYSDAYDLLEVMRTQYGHTNEWVRLMLECDEFFVRSNRQRLSRLYPIDKLTYQLQLDTANSPLRYKLVDALMQVGRFYEAEQILKAQFYINPNDAEYLSRMQNFDTQKRGLAAQKVNELEVRSRLNPSDLDALRQLAAMYQVVGDVNSASRTYAAALQVAGGNTDLRYEYALFLMSSQQYDLAIQETEALLRFQPNNAKFKNLYASSTLFSGKVDARTETYLNDALAADSRNIDILANLALLKIYQCKFDEAENYTRRAQTFVQSDYVQRLEELDRLIAQGKLDPNACNSASAGDSNYLMLDQARQFHQQGKFFEAADMFEMYFSKSGKVNQGLLIEMANSIQAGGDIPSAISVLQRAQMESFNADVAMRMAQMRYDIGDYAGAKQVLDQLVTVSASPDALILLGDTNAKMGMFVAAKAAYMQALSFGERSEIRQRIAWTEKGGTGYDYTALVIPSVQIVRAKGFDTAYARNTYGLNTQVTLPIPVVLTAGYASHGIEGTRYLLRPGFQTGNYNGTDGQTNPCAGIDSAIPCEKEWFNQVSLGAFWDITKPTRSKFYRDNYTNRLSLEGGLYDYSGGRTAPYYIAKFYHRKPGSFRAILGSELNEGTISLWSPAGATDKLQLLQHDLTLASDHQENHGKVRWLLNGAIGTIKDALSNVGFQQENRSLSARGELGFKVGKQSYLGVEGSAITYDYTTNYYFSPTDWNYQEYGLWFEANRERNKGYLRLRPSVGLIGNSDFGYGRLDLEFLHYFRANMALGLNGRGGYAYRYKNRQTASNFNKYTILIGGVSFYWTL